MSLKLMQYSSLRHAAFGIRCLIACLMLVSAVSVAFADDDDREHGSGVVPRLLSVFGLEDDDARDDDDDENVIARAGEYIDERAVVRIGESRAALAGIQVATLSTTTVREMSRARAVVVDAGPLIEVRRQIRQSETRRRAAGRRLGIADDALRRLKELSGGAEPPRQRLREVQLERNAAAAALTVATEDSSATRHRAALVWGEKLLAQSVDANEGDLMSWLRNHTLLLVTLAPGSTLPPDIRSLEFDDPTRTGRQRRGEIITATTMVGYVQGETWLAEADGGGLGPGMRFNVDLPLSDDEKTGVEVPASAVVWHYGKPWIYVQHEAGVYLRTEIVDYRRRRDDWFVSEPSLDGARLVTIGAQALLSEESRWNIPEEDDAD